MTITCDAGALREALGTFGGLIDRSNTIPILGHVRMSAMGGMLTLSAINLDMAAAVDLPADGTLDPVCPNYATMVGGVGSLAKSSVLVTDDAKAGRLTCKQGGSVRTVRTLPPADFPLMPDMAADVEFAMPASDLHRILEFCRDAMSTEQARYYLNGIHWRATAPGRLVTEATDGISLRQLALDIAGVPVDMPRAIMGRQLLAMLAKVPDDGDITLAFNSQRVMITAGPTRIISRLVDGTFPDADRIIPARGAGQRLTVNGEELARATRAAAAVDSGKVRTARLAMSADGSSVSSRTEGGDEALEPVQGAEWTGKPMTIGINAQFLAATAAAFGDRTIEVEFTGTGNPILFRSDALPGAAAVVMPIRL